MIFVCAQSLLPQHVYVLPKAGRCSSVPQAKPAARFLSARDRLFRCPSPAAAAAHYLTRLTRPAATLLHTLIKATREANPFCPSHRPTPSHRSPFCRRSPPFRSGLCPANETSESHYLSCSHHTTWPRPSRRQHQVATHSTQALNNICCLVVGAPNLRNASDYRIHAEQQPTKHHQQRFEPKATRFACSQRLLIIHLSRWQLLSTSSQRRLQVAARA